MTTFASEATFRAPLDAVFDYATDPCNWREWYPKTSHIAREARGPAGLGDRWTEDVTIVGMRLRIAWETTRVERATRWTVRGVVASGLLLRPLVHGGVIEIDYAFGAAPDGTRFRRAISYEMPGALGRLVGRLALDRRIEREVNPAIENLKRIVERRAS